jgi:NAD(P)-dependent dehydrogenase (short-subunit alcohol dehydrogenase family)
MRLNNVAAIVTGGASGLGGATAEMLAQGGAKVTVFDLNEELGLTAPGPFRVCHAGQEHPRQSDAQRRNDPSRRRDSHGAALIPTL